MSFHPTGQDLLGQTDEIARRNELITVATHSVALFSGPILFFGFLGFSRRLGLERSIVSAALVAYGIAVLASTCAAVINGLVGPVLTRQILLADESSRPFLRIIFMNNTLLNQAFDKVFLVSSSVAIICWSLSIIKGNRLSKFTAIFGCCLGLVSVMGLFSGYLRMNIHGFGLLIAGQVVWTLLVAAFLFRSHLIQPFKLRK